LQFNVYSKKNLGTFWWNPFLFFLNGSKDMVCWKMYNFLRPPCICVSCQCFDSIGWLGIRKNIQLVESWLMLIADLRGAAFEPAWSRMDVARGLPVVSTHSSNSYSYWWGWRHCVVPVFCSSVHTCMCVHVSVCISACVQTVAFPDSVLLTSSFGFV